YVRARSGAYPVKQLKDYKGKLISRKLPDDFVPIELGEGGVALGIDYQGKRLTPKEIIDLFLEESVQTLPPTLVEKLNTIKEGKIADLDLKFAGEVVPVSEVKSVMTQILRSFIEEGFDGAVIKPYKGAKVWLVFQPEKLQTLEGVRIDTISNLVDNLPTPKTALGKKVVEDIKEKFTKEHISRTVEPEDITPFNVENFLDDFIEETKLDRSLNKENPTFRVTEESLKIMESLEDLRGRLSAPIDEIFNVPPKQTLNEFLANKDNRKAINLLEKEYKLPEGTLTPEFIKKLSEGDEGITYLYAGLGDLKSLWNGVNDFIKAMKKLWQRILDMNWSLRRKMKSYLKDVSEDYGRGRSSDNFFSNWGREQVDLVPWDRPLLNKLTNWSRSRRARTQANEVGLIRVLGQWAYGSERFRIVEGKPTPAVETPAVETPAVETPAVEEKPSLETKIISSKMLIDPVFNKVTAKDLLEPDRIPRLSDEQMDKVREEIDIIERGAPKTLQEARAEVERKNFVTIKALENRISTLMSKMGELKEDHPFKLLLSKFIKKEISDNQRIITSMREKLSLMNDTLDDLKQDLLLGKINKKELDDFKEKIKSSSTRLNKLNKDLAILNDWKKFVSKGSVEALPTMELPYYNNFIRELQKEAELATANDIPLSPEIAFLQDEKYAILPTPKQEGAVTLESADLWLKEVLPRLKKDQESVYHDHLENAIKSTKQSSEFFDETGIQSKKESEHKIDFYYELKDGRFRDTKVNRQHLFDFLTTVHGNIEQSIRVFKNITPEEKVFLDTYVLSTHEYGPASIDAPPTTPDVPPTQDIIYAGAESKRGMIQHGVVRHRMRLLGDFKTKLEIREKELKKLAPKLGVNPKAFGEELSRQIFEIHQSIEVQKRKGILKELNIKEMFSDAFVKRLGITNLVLKNPKYKKEVKNFISDILADLDSLVTGAKGDIPKEVIPFVHAAPALQWDLFRDLNQLVTGKYWLSDMIADHIGFVSEGEHKVQTALKDINSPTKEVISILIESRIKKGESLKAFVIDEKQLLEILTPEQLKLLNKKLGKRYTNSELEVKIIDAIGDSAEVYINLSETIPELILDPIKIKRHLEGARIRESNLGQKLEGNTLKNFTLLDIMRHDLFDTLNNIGTKTIDDGIQKEILNEFIEVFETISGEGSFKKEFGDKIKTVEDLFNHIESIADDLSREGTITIRKEFDLMLALLKADLTGNRPKGNLSSAVTMLQKAASANSVLGFA
nr:hypothetical protein [Pelagibacterales bacterium]